MKLNFYLILSVCFLANEVFAQKAPPPPAAPRPSIVVRGQSDRPAPPPPPPLIYSAPDKSSFGKFSSGKLGFTVVFPGKPEIAESKADGADINVFKIKLKGSNESVEIFDYGFDVERKLSKDEVFAQVKQKYLSGETSELISEKDVEQNGIKGREFNFEISYELYKVRVFVSNGRIYELVATVTNWHILKDGVKEKAQAFNDEAERFFASFKIDAPAPAIGADKNIDGKIVLFKSKNNIYEAEDGSFSVYLPGKPTVAKNRVVSGFGETDLHIITLPTMMAYYGVTYFDYPVVITDQSEIRFISDEQRDALLRKNYTLVSEKDISYKGSYGREYVMTFENNTVVMRNFFAKQRFFRLLVFTRGLKDKIPAPFAEKYENVKYRFLDSFEAGKLPPPEFSDVKMPEDFGLRKEKSTVYSDYFGFSMNLPENWEILDDAQVELLKRYGFAAIDKQNEIAQAWTEKSLQNTRFLFVTINKEDPKDKPKSIVIGAEKLTLPRFLPEAAATLYIREMLDKNEEVVGGGINKLKIDGIDFAWFETLDKETGEKQRIYYSNIKNLAFMIVFTYESDEDLKVFTDKLNTVKFKK